jgi:ABC-2 type transport system ATP-binding protein
MISLAFDRLTKRYGAVTAVDGLSAGIRPGRVTVFLGANGSGKTTSMRALLGLTPPTSGTATIDGRSYRQLGHPARVVGAVLDQGFHPNRSARQHLRIAALQAGMPAGRADELLAYFGLTEAAGRRVGGYSLGMRQRLALATALTGNPGVLVLDEPFNGLDPEGITTLRAFLRRFADGGGTVFLSSHLLGEIEHVADDCIIIDRGRLVAAGPVADLLRGRAGDLEGVFAVLVHGARDGFAPSALPGSAPGALPGSAPGALPGSAPGAPGSTQQILDRLEVAR